MSELVPNRVVISLWVFGLAVIFWHLWVTHLLNLISYL